VCKIKPIEAVKEAVVAEPTPAPPVKKGPFGRPLKPKAETQEV
jgi:hypothetical protein